MASLLEKLIAFYAPHSCLKCSIENNILCRGCLFAEFDTALESCYVCAKPASTTGICQSCSKASVFDCVTACAEYQDTAKELIHALKFGGVRQSAVVMAQIMDVAAPRFPDESVVVPIPTAPARVRMRGYDHASLIAKEFARLRNYSYLPLLARQTTTRQLGASKQKRQEFAEVMFYNYSSKRYDNLILLDDVITTGATMNAAGTICKDLANEGIFGLALAKHSI